jgi:predicted nucleic acid-binding Zn ribbon protein
LSNNERKRATPLSEALETYFERHGMKRRIRQASVIPEWADLVGPQIANVTNPREVLRDGTLIVSVKSAAWMQELQMMSPEILRQLGTRKKNIKRIMWRAG